MLGQNGPQIDAFLKDARKLSGDLAAMTPKLTKPSTASTVSPPRSIRPKSTASSTTSTSLPPRSAIPNGSCSGFVDDASDLGRKFNASADRLDAILKNVDTMVTSPEGKGMFTQITETAKAIRTLADNLDARTGELAQESQPVHGLGTARLQGPRGRWPEDAARHSAHAQQPNRNPQQLIFGPKSSIPDYKGK